MYAMFETIKLEFCLYVYDVRSNPTEIIVSAVLLGEQPRRIAHSPKSRAYAVITLVTNFDPYQETETSHLKLLDDQVDTCVVCFTCVVLAVNWLFF